MKRLVSELDLWEEGWSQSKSCLPYSVSETLRSISFPCFRITKTAWRILETLAVTSFSCERSFPALRNFKMYNRSTMCNRRLSALALLYIHVEIHTGLKSILEKFIALGPHQLELDLWDKWFCFALFGFGIFPCSDLFNSLKISVLLYIQDPPCGIDFFFFYLSIYWYI